MADTLTLADLRTQVRTQSDQGNSTQDSDAEVDAWINRGMRAMVRRIIRCAPEFYEAEATITTTAGTYEYTVPTGFLSIRGVDRIEGDDRYTMQSYSFRDRNRHRNRHLSTNGRDQLPRYRIARGGQDGAGVRLVFDRDPGSNQYLLHYVEVPVDLSDPADTIDGVLGLTDYIITAATALARAKHQEDASLELAEMARLEEDILALVQQRTADGTQKIANRDDNLYQDDFEPWPT